MLTLFFYFGVFGTAFSILILGGLCFSLLTRKSGSFERYVIVAITFALLTLSCEVMVSATKKIAERDRQAITRISHTYAGFLF